MILATLKQATQPLHQRLEANPYSVELMRGSISLERYTQLLQIFFGFYAPVEQLLGQIGGWQLIGLDFEQRRKAAWIERDLRALGCDPQAIAELPRCAELPAIETFPQALGCLYVLEGATLGGQVISRQIAKQLGLGPAGGARFFSSYGGELGPMWKAFCAAANTYAAERDHDQAIVEAARDCFQKLDRWISASASSIARLQCQLVEM